MPIAIKLKQGKYYAPVIVCDVCAEIISDARQGNYEWAVSPDGEHIIGPVFTHKSDCSRLLEHIWRQQYPDYCTMWEGLKALPLYLRNNLKLKERDLKNAARFAAMFE